MGDPRKTRKHFKRPLRIWDKANIEREKILKETYGLKNKQEIWKTETMLRKKRNSARSLLALPLEERMKRQEQLLKSLARIGILDAKATLDDVLTLNVESFLERRLQTIVWRKGLANTATQARQFITHGHIAISGKRVTAPSYVIKAEEEGKIGYYAGKKMVLKPPVEEKKKGKKKTVKDKFEEAKPAEEKPAEISSAETMAAVRAAREKAVKEAEEGKKPEGKEPKAEKKEEGKKEAAGKEKETGKKEAEEKNQAGKEPKAEKKEGE